MLGLTQQVTLCKRDMFSRHHPADEYSIALIPYTAEQKLPTANKMTVTKPRKHDSIGKEGTSTFFCFFVEMATKVKT